MVLILSRARRRRSATVPAPLALSSVIFVVIASLVGAASAALDARRGEPESEVLPEPAPIPSPSEEADAGSEKAVEETPAADSGAGLDTADSFGPEGCVKVLRTAAGTCLLNTACKAVSNETLSKVEFAFICLNPGTAVPHALHTFGTGGFRAEESFDTGVACAQCTSVATAFASGGPLIRAALRSLPPGSPGVAALKPADAYDCKAGLSNWLKGWSAEKKDWCCKYKDLACFDCKADFDNREAAWSDRKKEYCCKFGLPGCPTTTTTTTSEPFDCEAGVENSEAGWSDEKKLWCCEEKNVSCPTTTTSQPFDCDAGYSNWEAGWSDDKKEWCCANKGRGCPTTTTSQPFPTFDCTADASQWKAAWSTEKKQWCCQAKSIGCEGSSGAPAPPREAPAAPAPLPEAEVGATTLPPEGPTPYDCKSKVVAWTEAKKQWCCAEKGTGCAGNDDAQTTTSEPFDCDTGVMDWESYVVDWSPEKTDWCCKNKAVGCASTTMPPFDCDAGYANWESGWSFDKKLWCCQATNRGCVKGAAPWFNCTAGYDRRSTGWSPEKKEWCCKEKEIGCSKSAVRVEAGEDRGGQVREMKPAEAAFYGPSGCVSTFLSPVGTCIVQTRCAGVNVSSFNFGLTCADKSGGYKAYYFGPGALGTEETFDSRLKCSTCLGVGDSAASMRKMQGTLPKAVIDDVTSLKDDVRKLQEEMQAIKALMKKGLDKDWDKDKNGKGENKEEGKKDDEKEGKKDDVKEGKKDDEKEGKKDDEKEDAPPEDEDFVVTTTAEMSTTYSLAPAPSFAAAPSASVDKVSPEEAKKRRMEANKEQEPKSGGHLIESAIASLPLAGARAGPRPRLTGRANEKEAVPQAPAPSVLAPAPSVLVLDSSSSGP